MGNSNSERSRATRQAEADKHQREKLADGTYRQVLIRGKTSIITEFIEVLNEIGGTRPQAIEKICKMYRQQKGKK